MKLRYIAVSAVVSWVGAECWAAPWNPVWWPRTHWTVLLSVFGLLFLLAQFTKTRDTATDLSLLSIVAAMAAALAWNLWMMHGWFPGEWTQWLASATRSDGEGAYRMVEYQFFILIFVALTAFWLVANKRLARRE